MFTPLFFFSFPVPCLFSLTVLRPQHHSHLESLLKHRFLGPAIGVWCASENVSF